MHLGLLTFPIAESNEKSTTAVDPAVAQARRDLGNSGKKLMVAPRFSPCYSAMNHLRLKEHQSGVLGSIPR